VNDLLANVVAGLNRVADAAGRVLLAPIALVPGWASATAIAAVTGVLLLLVFKHTSNQKAIKGVRDGLSANLLAVRLFKDSTAVTLRSQARMIGGASKLLVLAIVPILVMTVPVLLVLGQLSLWYQARPIRVGEEAVLTLALAGEPGEPMPRVTLRPSDAVEVDVGPVRIPSRRVVCWELKGRTPGVHRLAFEVDGRPVEKEIAVGDGFLRVSALRPGWRWEDILFNPAEPPFPPDSPVRSVAIAYPERPSWTSGTGAWVYYWFAVSMVAALAFRKQLNVNI
jgi:hypothetical protein